MTRLLPIMWCVGCMSTPLELPPQGSELTISGYPDGLSGAKHFDRYVTVFGVYILATSAVSDDKLMHASRVMAAYLDNDQNGDVDDELVVGSMVDQDATLAMFGTNREARRVLRSGVLDEVYGQDLYETETDPEDGFDASLEEVLHLITGAGYARAYPEAFDEARSELTAAMDIARGGSFEDIPSSYPEDAWFHYDDRTCEYRCMATEYVYWALTSLLGAQADRCGEIRDEWELCTAAQVEETDPAVTALLRDGRFTVPTILPTGAYAP